MKSDKGFDESEKLLNQLEEDIHREYAQAAKEMAEKAEAYFAKFAAQDEAQRELYEQGKITKKEYGEWRQRKMLTGKQYTEMRDTLAKDLTNADKIAMNYTRDKAIDTYALNMNYETYNIENDLKVDTSFTLYNHDAVQRLIKDKPDLLPQPSPDAEIDLKWNMQHLQSAITQAILQGESIPKVAERMMRVAAMDDRAAIRNARTAMTGAQNGGRLDAMERAKERGVNVKKGWMATLDNRTRDSHVALDGEEKEIDEEFSNGLMFPGDPEADEPAEVYNCRCRMIHVYPKYPVDWSNTELRNTDNLGDQTYEEWKNRHKEAKEIPEETQEETTVVTNKAEAEEALQTMFGSIEPKFFKNDEQLVVDSTNRLIELNKRFGALDGNKGFITSSPSGRAMAYVSSAYRKDFDKVNLSLVNKYYKDPGILKSEEIKAKESFWSMPFTEDKWNVYTVTHEYGHILQFKVSQGREDWDALEEKVKAKMAKNASYSQIRNIYKDAEKAQAKQMFEEILDIAKADNEEFNLRDQLSRYGASNYYEAFAEIFANSQCGEPNQLGKAMEKWLEKEGF